MFHLVDWCDQMLIQIRNCLLYLRYITLWKSFVWSYNFGWASTYFISWWSSKALIYFFFNFNCIRRIVVFMKVIYWKRLIVWTINNCYCLFINVIKIISTKLLWIYFLFSLMHLFDLFMIFNVHLLNWFPIINILSIEHSI